jgi:hypothetical protein
MYMTNDLLDPDPTNTVDFIMMASRAYSTKNTDLIKQMYPKETTLADIDITKD